MGEKTLREGFRKKRKKSGLLQKTRLVTFFFFRNPSLSTIIKRGKKSIEGGIQRAKKYVKIVIGEFVNTL